MSRPAPRPALPVALVRLGSLVSFGFADEKNPADCASGRYVR